MGERIEIILNAEELLRALEQVDAKADAVEDKVEDVIDAAEAQDEKIDATKDHASYMKKVVDQTVEESEKEVIEMMQDSYEKQSQLVEDVKEEAVRSFNEVMGYMRASYLLISGVSRILGGNMTQAFSMMYSVGMSAIATYKAVAAAMAATGPVGWVQAGLMMVSLTTATSSLIAILVGQRELSTNIRGINMSLHGISALIGDLYFL